jgi:SecD/SecF fusion protein
MKYSLPKKIIYSIIVAVLLVGLVLTAFFGLNGKGYGSTYDIDLGLDLAGGVSITYQIKEDNFTSQDVEDTIYKLQKRVEGKSTESQVYKEGDNRITVEIPGVTDANEILKELGTPGSLEFLDSTGYTAFSQGNDYTPLLTGLLARRFNYIFNDYINTYPGDNNVLNFTTIGEKEIEELNIENIG